MNICGEVITPQGNKSRVRQTTSRTDPDFITPRCGTTCIILIIYLFGCGPTRMISQCAAASSCPPVGVTTLRSEPVDIIVRAGNRFIYFDGASKIFRRNVLCINALKGVINPYNLASREITSREFITFDSKQCPDVELCGPSAAFFHFFHHRVSEEGAVFTPGKNIQCDISMHRYTNAFQLTSVRSRSRGHRCDSSLVLETSFLSLFSRRAATHAVHACGS